MAKKVSSVGSKLASKMKAAKQVHAEMPKGQAPHVVVIARAGTGKTTTAIEGLKVVRGLTPSIQPSEQQQAIWQQMLLSRDAATVCFCCFSKSIQIELAGRVPMGVEASTMHSMGFKAVQKAIGRCQPSQFNDVDIICRLLGRHPKDVRREEPVLLKATQELVSLCKMNLADPTPENLDIISGRFEIEVNGQRNSVYDLVPKVLQQCRSPRGSISFDDMIWLPVVLNLPLFRFDLLIVDEAQDLNKCQQELAVRAGKRIIMIGDPRQALYGFAGADTSSIPNMQKRLEETSAGCVTLSLTVTRRCGKAIVEEAKQYVPDFEAHKSNGPGKISIANYPLQGPKGDKTEVPYDKNYMSQVSDGDFVICRCNAPLVSQCFRFLKMGRKATIQGRNIGQGIISQLDKLKAESLVDLIAKIGDWYSKEVEKENAKRVPSDTRLIALEDKYDCLLAFTDSVHIDTVEVGQQFVLQMARVSGEVVQLGTYPTRIAAEEAKGQKEVEVVRTRIENVFTDDRNSPGVRLSSIHRVKGLESKTVFFLMPEEAPCPHPMARSEWQRDAEICCLYVGITRAIEHLVYVS